MEEVKHMTFRGLALFSVLLIFCVSDTVTTNGRYIIDTTPGVGRRFDGIGAISGGGVIYLAFWVNAVWPLVISLNWVKCTRLITVRQTRLDRGKLPNGGI